MFHEKLSRKVLRGSEYYLELRDRTMNQFINALAHDPEKPAAHLIRGVQRFSARIMRKQQTKARSSRFRRRPRGELGGAKEVAIPA
jgi:hypothetical protein